MLHLFTPTKYTIYDFKNNFLITDISWRCFKSFKALIIKDNVQLYIFTDSGKLVLLTHFVAYQEMWSIEINRNLTQVIVKQHLGFKF